jgi:uncharacterized protein
MMPATLSYPGVYVEEIPSGVRTLTGVATSIAAFIGRAPRGPVNDPIVINNYGDYTRAFGGLDRDSPMSYAVRDFFLNGGGQAIVVRLYRDKDRTPPAPSFSSEHREGETPPTPPGPAKAISDALPAGQGSLQFQAASPGSWGQKLAVGVQYDGITDEVAARYGMATGDLFNLIVYYDYSADNARPAEIIRNVSVKDGPRRVDRVLAQESGLIRINGNLPKERPQQFSPLPDRNRPTRTFTGGDDGQTLDLAAYAGDRAKKTGMYALLKADLFNILCIPPDSAEGDTPAAVYQEAAALCAERRAMLVVDPPAAWGDSDIPTKAVLENVGGLGISGPNARNAALYFPRVRQPDPLREGQIGTFVPCGIVAGLYARTDTERGVWKAPAGLDAALVGVQDLQANLTDMENGQLNPLGINCLRSFPVAGRVVWGARTMRGADQLSDEYKYVPVRRLALYIEESLYRGLKWVVFEPNDEPLWAQIRLNAGAFMNNLFRQGAFQGASPRDAYFVKCDRETTTQNDINLGIVNILIGFAPLKPAEFVVVKLQQMAGQIQT